MVLSWKKIVIAFLTVYNFLRICFPSKEFHSHFNWNLIPVVVLIVLVKLGVNLPFLFWLLLNLYSLNFIFCFSHFPCFFQFRNFSRAVKNYCKPGQIKNRFLFFFAFFQTTFWQLFILSSNSVDTKWKYNKKKDTENVQM